MLKDVGDDPSDEKVKDYVLKTLDGGVGIVYCRYCGMFIVSKLSVYPLCYKEVCC